MIARNKNYVCLIIGILLSARITLQASTPSSNYYVGAVVEYHPISMSDNGTTTANENAKNFMKFLQTASENEVDIVVFPENSLMAGISDRSGYLLSSTYIPEPKDAKVPCHDLSSNVIEAMKAISCAAKRYATYIVINVNEKEKCSGDKCSPDGHMLYNTNVVFDRTGAVVARYRKWNILGEKTFNRTIKAELSTFTTDFGVTFGQFICFDILFETPSLTLLREKKVTDIVFSAYWHSELPFLMSNEIQSAWSYVNNVNFLGSGYNSPDTASGGSGIYAGREGAFARVWSEKRVNALIVAKIPKILNARRNQAFNPADAMTFFYKSTDILTTSGPEPVPQQILKGEDISPYKTELFQPTNNTHNFTLCDRGLCCHFKIHSEHREDLVQGNAKYYRYRLAAFNGVRSFDETSTGGLEVCSFLSCTDNSLASCNKRFDINTIIVHPTTFRSIVITGDFKKSLNISRLPISLNTDMQSLNVSDFTFNTKKINETHINLIYTLTKPRKDLMTFAIYGRNFTADGMPKSASSTTKSFASIHVIFMMLVVLGIDRPMNWHICE